VDNSNYVIFNHNYMNENKGQFVLIVGPTCVGKTTLINALKEKITNAGVIVSTTTRAMRPNEVDGVDYEFTTDEDFEEREKMGEFYEAVRRPTGYYGSSRLQVQDLLAKHSVVFGALDVEGCRIVKSMDPETLVIFLYPGDMADLRERLRLRGTAEDEVRARLTIADEEMLSRDEFDEAILNIDGKFDETVKKVMEVFKERGIGGGVHQ